MKKLFLSALMLLVFFRASAQVSLELALDQDEFLPNEAIRLTVKITNTSGQQLHLGADQAWLTFSVESADGIIIEKKGEVPVVEEFDLESSQMATKHVDLEPYFQLGRPARYKVTATMRIKEWGLAVNSAPVHFDIIHGGEIWTQDFGVLVATNAPPEPRKYTLIKANYLREQLRLYVQVSSGNGGNVFRVAPLGPLVSFSSPEESVDRVSQLHVLWQTGSQSFSYMVIAPDGSLMLRDSYDNFNSRPHLRVNDNGDVEVRGGARRPKPREMPPASPPSPSSAPAAK
jgi:hypothetical protein